MKLNVQVNRGLDGKFQKLSNMLEGYRDVYLERMSSELVDKSPNDTGTYIKNHNIGTSEVPATLDQMGPRRTSGDAFNNPNREAVKQEGFEKLLADIAALPPDVMRLVFSNATKYQDAVELGNTLVLHKKLLKP